MKVIRLLSSIIFLVASIFLSGCGTEINLSSAGTLGPILKKPIDKSQRILVISALQDIKVDVISENIFSYRKFGSKVIAKNFLNEELSRAMVSTLKEHNFKYIQIRNLTTANDINTGDIELSTTKAKEFLSSQLANTHSDFILLLTQSHKQSLVYDIKCELGKKNQYDQARFEQHLDLYKLYLIDAHTLQVLSWTTGSPNFDLPNVRLCKPLKSYGANDLKELNITVGELFRRAIKIDLIRTLRI